MNMVRLKSLKLFIQAFILGVCFANGRVFAQTWMFLVINIPLFG